MKRAFDLVVALAALVALAPLLVLVALAVKLTSRGPVLFHAERAGRGGRPFRLHKFRTMTHGAAGPALTTADDARVTLLGHALRRTHADELPQLWNVVTGEMSLVGPRPEDPRFVAADDPAWRRVLSVRPGITGPTQLAFAGREAALLGGDPERGYRERVLPEKLRSDLDYATGRSFAADLAILGRTALFAVGVGG